MRNYSFLSPSAHQSEKEKVKKKTPLMTKKKSQRRRRLCVSRRILIALPAERKEGICEFSNPLLAANLQWKMFLARSERTQIRGWFFGIALCWRRVEAFTLDCHCKYCEHEQLFCAFLLYTSDVCLFERRGRDKQNSIGTIFFVRLFDIYFLRTNKLLPGYL